jgi:tetratricopeptide (TPR) repeat protein
MPPDRRNAIETDSLRRLAGTRSFERGEAYFAEGRVLSLVEFEGTISAKVLGTQQPEYHVTLQVGEGAPQSSCDCPVGSEGDFCKHCVAAGLAWLAEKTPGKTSPKEKVAAPTIEDVRGHLAGLDKDTLVDMIMRQAVEDERLLNSLSIKAVRGKPGEPDLAAYMAVLRGAIEVDEYVSHWDAYEYSQGVGEAVDLVGGLLEDGYSAEVIELCEYALLLVEEAYDSVDHGGASIGYYSERLQDLHHSACRKANPDPKELAGSIFEWGLQSDWGIFGDAVEKYADVLGEKGLAEYRRLADEEWRKVPALGPDDKSAYDSRRSRITGLMERLARLGGNVDELVEIKKRDLSSPYEFLEIAETYRQVREYNRALEWAERGLAAFPGRADPRLREFLANEYCRRGRHDEAVEMAWDNFADSPRLDTYRVLKNHAQQTQSWPEWQEKALRYMRDQLAEARKKAPKSTRGGYRPTDHSELVRVFLWGEEDVEAAWKEAIEGGCLDDLWMRLAELREEEHPEDSLEVYKAQVEPIVDQKNKESYREAVELMRKINSLMEKIDQGGKFPRFITTVRTKHGRKRNLMKLLDREKWF